MPKVPMPEFNAEELEAIKEGLSKAPIWLIEKLIAEKKEFIEALAECSQAVGNVHSDCADALLSSRPEVHRSALKVIQSRCETMAEKLIKFSSPDKNKTNDV